VKNDLLQMQANAEWYEDKAEEHEAEVRKGRKLDLFPIAFGLGVIWFCSYIIYQLADVIAAHLWDRPHWTAVLATYFAVLTIITAGVAGIGAIFDKGEPK